MNNQSEQTGRETQDIDLTGTTETGGHIKTETMQGKETDRKTAARQPHDDNPVAHRQKKQLISLLAIVLVFGGIGFFYWTNRVKPVEASPELKIPLLGKLVQTPQSSLINAQKISGGRFLVNSVEYDQGRLSIVSADGQINRQYKFESPIPFVRPLDQNKFAVGTVLGDLYLVDADHNGAATKLLSFDNGMISCLAQADGDNLIAGNLEGEVVYWNAAEQKITAAWKTPDGTTPRVCSAYGEKELLVVDAFSNVFAAPLFGKNSLKQIKSLSDDGAYENGKYIPGSNLLAICQNSVLNIYRLPEFNGVMRLNLDPEYLDFLISPNAKTVVVFTPGGFKAYDLNGQEIFSQPINGLASVSYLTDYAVLTVTGGGEPVEYSFMTQKIGQ